MLARSWVRRHRVLLTAGERACLPCRPSVASVAGYRPACSKPPCALIMPLGRLHRRPDTGWVCFWTQCPYRNNWTDVGRVVLLLPDAWPSSRPQSSRSIIKLRPSHDFSEDGSDKYPGDMARRPRCLGGSPTICRCPVADMPREREEHKGRGVGDHGPVAVEVSE